MEKIPNPTELNVKNKKENGNENKIFELEIIEEFSHEKQKEIINAAIDSGVGYIVPEKFIEKYKTNGNFCKEFCLPNGLFIPKNLEHPKAILSFMQPRGIAKDFNQLEISKLTEGLQEYCKSIEQHYDLVRLWLYEHKEMFPRNVFANLELEKKKPDSFFDEASIFRADTLIGADGKLFVCDPNAVPLLVGSIAFLRNHLNLPNKFELYEEILQSIQIMVY